MTAAALYLLMSCVVAPSSAEDRAVPLADVTRATVPAQKEVSASSGPFRLTFGLYKTKIKVGESLWYRIRLTNLGKKPLIVGDDIFVDPWNIRSNANIRRGVFLVVTDSTGKPVEPVEFSPAHEYRKEGLFLDPKIDPELPGMMDEWRKQGMSDEDVRWKAVEYVKRKRGKEAWLERRRELQPGQSFATPPWINDGRAKPWLNQPAREPIGDFAELEMFAFKKPGTYRVRAVYDRRSGPQTPAEWKKMTEMARESSAIRAILEEHKRTRRRSDEVLAQTAWIEVMVLP